MDTRHNDLSPKFKSLRETACLITECINRCLINNSRLISSALIAADLSDPLNPLGASVACSFAKTANNATRRFTAQNVQARAIFLPNTAIGEFISNPSKQDGLYPSKINNQHLTYIKRADNFCVQLAFEKSSNEIDLNEVTAAIENCNYLLAKVSEQLDKLRDDEPLCQGLLLNPPNIANAFVINIDIVKSTESVKHGDYPKIARFMAIFGQKIDELIATHKDIEFWPTKYEGDGYSIIIPIPQQIIYDSLAVGKFETDHIKQLVNQVANLMKIEDSLAIAYRTRYKSGYISQYLYGTNGEVFWEFN